MIVYFAATVGCFCHETQDVSAEAYMLGRFLYCQSEPIMGNVLVIIFALLAYATGMQNVYGMTWNELECPIQLNVRMLHGLLADSVDASYML